MKFVSYLKFEIVQKMNFLRQRILLLMEVEKGRVVKEVDQIPQT
jgi:hypothetical protein